VNSNFFFINAAYGGGGGGGGGTAEFPGVTHTVVQKIKIPKFRPQKVFWPTPRPPPKSYTHVKSLLCLWKAKKIYIFSLWAAHGHGKNHAIA